LATLHYQIQKDSWQAMRMSKVPFFPLFLYLFPHLTHTHTHTHTHVKDFNIYFLKEFAFLRKKSAKAEKQEAKGDEASDMHRSERSVSVCVCVSCHKLFIFSLVMHKHVRTCTRKHVHTCTNMFTHMHLCTR
jgi:hypothetical protein